MELFQEGENIILRSVAKPVGPELFGTDKLRNMILEMKETLSKESDGVALAAPQVGIDLRMFVVASNLASVSNLAPTVYINPRFEKLSKEKVYMEEGCLSVRWLYGEVKRHTKVTMVAQDIDGKIFKRGAGGLLAHIYQHECEHLDGVLFIDNAKHLVRLDDDVIDKMKSKNSNKE